MHEEAVEQLTAASNSVAPGTTQPQPPTRAVHNSLVTYGSPLTRFRMIAEATKAPTSLLPDCDMHPVRHQRPM